MSGTGITDTEFLDRLQAAIEKNMAQEQFGVSELAETMNMSRSNLLRKVKKDTQLSVSQLINQARMKRAMELLRTTSLNVSEVSVQVGFNSASYFIKCFREFYGYPPGEANKKILPVENPLPAAPYPTGKRKKIIMAGLAILILVTSLILYKKFSTTPISTNKSIVVLPFKNESNDSSNIYLINGLMESTLNHLQKIKDLKVISRTSAEKYRHTSHSLPEIANELHATYFVEGSGQKIGDQILLNIQLIEGPTDKHLWARQYKRETKDIFTLQQEIARDIAEEIQVIITPEEDKRIRKVLTHDLIAYDLFLKGNELLVKGSTENLQKAIVLFDSAIRRDPTFAMAYANATIAFYYLDLFQADKKYSNQMAHYADKAWLNDPTQAECLLAKALYYVHKKEYLLAEPYFEKALEFNPNSILILNFMTDFYLNCLPNTIRYLEYALKSVQREAATKDSITTSYNYLRLGNALLQTAFFDEALICINKSKSYFSKNPFAGYITAFIYFGKNKNCAQAKQRLLVELKKDTTRVDILQDIGNVCYLMGDYPEAAHYYHQFLFQRESRNLDVYRNIDLRLSIVLAKTGEREKATQLLKSFKDYADHDPTIYKSLNLATYYIYTGDRQQALEQLKLFAQQDNYLYWITLFKDDPDAQSIKSDPEFQKVIAEIEARFWNNHKKVKQLLEEEGLL